MNGRLVSDRFPYLPIRLTIRGTTFTLEALLDTGFDGDVIVPTGVISERLPPNNQITWTLADGSEVTAPVYLGRVALEGLGTVPVSMSIIGTEPLVGLNLAKRFAVTLDHGERVIVEP
jgi:predicted aspartyl protease